MIADTGKMSAKPPHHHGNLRPALIEAGIALLEEQGLAGLTLRRVAARVGVSHAAPAHHFDGKHGLLLAIAALGFRTFTRLMREERDRAGADPQQQLLGICRGYMRFADEHYPLFQLIFTFEIKENPDPELHAASAEAFAMLADTCALFETAPGGPGANEIMIWSLVHGYASLRHFSRLQRPEGGETMPFELILPKLTPRAR